MKLNVRTTFLLALAFCCYGCGQVLPKEYSDYSDRSGFVVKNIDSVNVDNLVVLAKVWGFAKYHHPVFADSIYNIDYELFELLPRVAYATKDECNSILYDWVKCLGRFKIDEERYKEQINDNGYILKADMGWIYDTVLLGEELSRILHRLRYAVRSNPSRYAKYIQETGQADFSAESDSGPKSLTDSGCNLLTLFRLWNMAEYYFPNVDITDKMWADVLIEYIPKFANTDAIHLTTAELIAELCDTHSAMYYNPIYSYRWIPVELKFIDEKLIVIDNRKYLADSEKPLFELGDEILSIDGYSPKYFVEKARKYISASNESALLRDAARLICNVSINEISLVIKREGVRQELVVPTISSEEYYNKIVGRIKNRAYNQLLNKSIGFLYAGKYKNEDAATIISEFKGTKAIIIDMRCYPSDFMPFEFVGRYLVPHKTQHVLFTKPVEKLPGYFEESPESLGHANENYYKGMLVVLVNEHTQSQAEYTTMAFQACPNTIVIGSQTAGADGNVSMPLLPCGNRTLFSGLGVYYPDGTNTQRTGVRIDHHVEPTIEGIKEGRDEVLEKALEIIESELSKDTEVPENL